MCLVLFKLFKLFSLDSDRPEMFHKLPPKLHLGGQVISRDKHGIIIVALFFFIRKLL